MKKMTKLDIASYCRNLLRWLALVSALLLVSCGGGGTSSNAPTGPNGMRVIVFGSSSSDAGTYKMVTIALGAPTAGKFTVNPGPLWAESVASHYGITLGPNRLAGFGYGPATLGGTDYAEGGARVSQQPGSGNTDASNGLNSGASTLPIKDQISTYLIEYGSFQNNDLVLIWAGANDVLGAIGTSSATATVQQAADDLLIQINRIKANGAQKIAVLNIDDLGKSPLHASDPVSANSATPLSLTFNVRLASNLQGASGVVLVDVFSKLADVRANPASYGVTNLMTPACAPYHNVVYYSIVCTTASLVAPNADQTYMYADTLHYTPRVNKIISDFVLANIASL
ncbi:MAG TPA: SGNH/GDSL hydrolase family protein [Burkholderiaceae bacterium]|jgi:phospholipase/lecithinase/hemolysin